MAFPAGIVVIAMVLSAGALAATPAEDAPPAEQALMEQLERARALNAQLAAEREQLQRNLSALEAEIAAKKRLLAPAATAAALPEPAPWWRSPLADAALAAGVVLAVAGLVIYWRRRGAEKLV